MLALALALVFSPFLVAGVNAEEYETLWEGQLINVADQFEWSFEAVNLTHSCIVHFDNLGNPIYYEYVTKPWQIDLGGRDSVFVEFVVSDFVQGVRVRIYGYDKDNNFQNEYVAITTNGLFTTAYKYKSVRIDTATFLEGRNEEFFLLIRYEKVGGSAGGPPYGDGPTVPIQLPNIPWHVKQILQGILDFLSLRHVRVVLGCSFFFVVGLIFLKYEKRVKKYAKF